MLNAAGEPRPDFALAELLGVHLRAGLLLLTEAKRAQRSGETAHSYLRLAPEVARRHAVLRGFEETDILAFGGVLEELTLSESAAVPLTFVPAFPIYPPETSWMRERETTIPGLVLSTQPNGARVAYLPADLDRRYGRDRLPDHGTLLANVVRWAVKDALPLRIGGPGLIDCHLYRQPGRLILHLVNLTSAATGRSRSRSSSRWGPCA